MSFIETRILDCVAYGTQGGPTFSTRMVPLNSGIVRRNPNRVRPIYRYSVIYRNLQAADHAQVIAAFNACLARVHSFRLKDWADFQATGEALGVAAAGSQTMQLQKTYTFGGQSTVREIRKPVDGTVQVFADGSPISATVDYATGEVTFTASIGQAITAAFQFDVPVMFDTDELAFSNDDRNDSGLFLTADVPLIEDLDA